MPPKPSLLFLLLALLLLAPVVTGIAAEPDSSPLGTPTLTNGTGGPVILAASSDPPFLSFAFEKLRKTFPQRFMVNLVSAIVLIGGIYYPNYRKKDFFFTFFMFNVTIFFITYLLNEVDLSMGAAFGLFAVFSLLRYRTENISAKDMTYLFVVIAIGLLSAANRGTLFEMILINGSIIITAFLLESNLIVRKEETKNLQYDSIEKVKPEHYQELLKELRTRTGLNVHKFTVGRIDYLRDTANIKIYYYGEPGED